MLPLAWLWAAELMSWAIPELEPSWDIWVYLNIAQEVAMSSSEWLKWVFLSQNGYCTFFGLFTVSKAPPCAPPTSRVPTGRDKAIPWLLPGVARNSDVSTHHGPRCLPYHLDASTTTSMCPNGSSRFFFLTNKNYIWFLDSNTLWHCYYNKRPQPQQNGSL